MNGPVVEDMYGYATMLGLMFGLVAADIPREEVFWARGCHC